MCVCVCVRKYVTKRKHTRHHRASYRPMAKRPRLHGTGRQTIKLAVLGLLFEGLGLSIEQDPSITGAFSSEGTIPGGQGASGGAGGAGVSGARGRPDPQAHP